MDLEILLSTTIQISRYDVARYLMISGERGQVAILHRIIEYIEEEGLRCVRSDEEVSDEEALSESMEKREIKWKAALELAVKCIPQIKHGPISVALNWVVDDDIGQSVYRLALNDATETGTSLHLSKEHFVNAAIEPLTYHGYRKCAEDWLGAFDCFSEATFSATWEAFKKAELAADCVSNI